MLFLNRLHRLNITTQPPVQVNAKAHDFLGLVATQEFKVQSSRFKVQGSKSSPEPEKAKIAGSGRPPTRSFAEKLLLWPIWCDLVRLGAIGGAEFNPPSLKLRRTGVQGSGRNWKRQTLQLAATGCNSGPDAALEGRPWLADWTPFRKKRQVAVSCS
jgi:hypothetical protein